MSAAIAHEVRENFGQRVAETRRALGLTQAQLAEQLEVTTNYVARIEGGHENLGLDSIARLAGHLHVEISELFLKAEPKAVRRGRPPVKKGPGYARAPSKRS